MVVGHPLAQSARLNFGSGNQRDSHWARSARKKERGESAHPVPAINDEQWPYDNIWCSDDSWRRRAPAVFQMNTGGASRPFLQSGWARHERGGSILTNMQPIQGGSGPCSGVQFHWFRFAFMGLFQGQDAASRIGGARCCNMPSSGRSRRVLLIRFQMPADRRIRMSAISKTVRSSGCPLPGSCLRSAQ